MVALGSPVQRPSFGKNAKLHWLDLGIVSVLVCVGAAWAIGDGTLGSARRDFDREIGINAIRMLSDGKKTFRHDTFGDEDFWGGQLRLHQAIAGAEHGGVG